MPKILLVNIRSCLSHEQKRFIVLVPRRGRFSHSAKTTTFTVRLKSPEVFRFPHGSGLADPVALVVGPGQLEVDGSRTKTLAENLDQLLAQKLKRQLDVFVDVEASKFRLNILFVQNDFERNLFFEFRHFQFFEKLLGIVAASLLLLYRL